MWVVTPALLQDTSPHSDVDFLVADRVVRAGIPFTVGLRLTMDPGWHSYWMNPGDSGQATSVKWSLPPGWTASDLRWPAPKRFDNDGFSSYGFDGEVVLLATVTPPTRLQGSQFALRADVEWLICEETCLPARETLELQLRSGVSSAPDSLLRAAISAAQSKIPRPLGGWSASAKRRGQTIDVLVRTPASIATLDGADFFPERAQVVAHSAPVRFERTLGGFKLSLPISEFAAKAPTRLSGVVVFPSSLWPITGARSWRIDVPIAPTSSLQRENNQP